jgi:hypothetical protein
MEINIGGYTKLRVIWGDGEREADDSLNIFVTSGILQPSIYLGLMS